MKSMYCVFLTFVSQSSCCLYFSCPRLHAHTALAANPCAFDKAVISQCILGGVVDEKLNSSAFNLTILATVARTDLGQPCALTSCRAHTLSSDQDHKWGYLKKANVSFVCVHQLPWFLICPHVLHLCLVNYLI